MKALARVLCSGLLAAVAGCGGGGGGSAPLPPLPPPPPPPVAGPLNDVTLASGISYEVGFTPPPFQVLSAIVESTHGGAGAGDCDGDGDIDLFVTYGDAGPNRLYLNQLAEQGDGLLFIDTAAAAGVANTRDPGLQQNSRHSGPIFADMDGDGDLDLFVGAIFDDPVKIFENNGDCTFVDVTTNSPEILNIMTEQTLMAAFGDYDLDGDLDMFMTHYGTPDNIYMPGFSEHLWENVSDPVNGIQFVNRSDVSGVADLLWVTRSFMGPSAGAPQEQELDFTFTPTFARMNSDLWPDIVIAGDGSTSQLLLNNGDGTFWDADTSERNLTNAQFGMGSALGDIDDDGDLDWFITSIYGENDPSLDFGNRIFRNDPLSATDLRLSDETDSMNVEQGGWGWGACFVDIDNDSDLDIYHTNGWPHAYFGNFYLNDPSVLFVKDGQNFTEEAATFGIDDTLSGRGVVCADFDEDGDIDFLLLTNKSPRSAILWENRTAAAGNNYLRVKLNGLAPNTEAAGARIFVTIGNQTQMREVMIGGNFIGQHPTVQHFGLGSAVVIDQVRVEWPARLPGPTQPMDYVAMSVTANQTLEISQP